MKEFWLCFVPLFVAVDAIGVLPLFLGLTEGVPSQQLRRVIARSVLTASAVALVFVLFGAILLRLLGITTADFMVAGGALLFVLSLADLVHERKPQADADHSLMGAVPLGVPLLAGPAVLTTSLLLVDQFGRVATAAAVVINMLIAGAVFFFAAGIHRFLGVTGTRVVQRVTLLLLAAIAVMTMRKGIEGFFLTG